MSKRTFLFGIGVGIIIGAALLQLMLIGEKQVEGLDPLSEPDEISSDAKLYTQAELDKAVADERKRVETEAQQAEAAKTNDNAAKDAEVSKTKDDKVPTKNAGNKSSASTETAKAPEAKRIVLRVPPNTSLSDTAVILKSHGVIENKQAFINLMRTKKIRAGYFAFKGKLSLHQVGTILTSKPLDPAVGKREMEAESGSN
ncbi:hypothetical protein A8990_101240 [Paenibacillus taihuensis]|uniref:YceG-like family protein n=1 Tax=Paenibacillus taihuensis TaxID=1156355 RepID=A0A3D9SEV8_9BACL|nr:hypothetical protein [Paenibacillus taihuensis]REE94446.1 hypothetical protein A8990_101240 [Paenibacillus taihuensis]